MFHVSKLYHQITIDISTMQKWLRNAFHLNTFLCTRLKCPAQEFQVQMPDVLTAQFSSAQKFRAQVAHYTPTKVNTMGAKLFYQSCP